MSDWECAVPIERYLQADPEYSTRWKAKVLGEIWDTVQDADAKFPEYHSLHEAYAILKEEMDELWDEIKMNGLPASIRAEVVDIGAVCIRLLRYIDRKAGWS